MIFSWPNIGLLVLNVGLAWLWLGRRGSDGAVSCAKYAKNTEPLEPREWTLSDLRQYDGTGPIKRILVAVDWRVFEVTAAWCLYGPGTIILLCFWLTINI